MTLRLPFLLPSNCALSIAVKSYLDELLAQDTPTSTTAKATVLQAAAERYFPHAQDVAGDLRTAWSLWDAVFEGVKCTGGLLKESERNHWGEVNAWLSARK